MTIKYVHVFIFSGCKIYSVSEWQLGCYKHQNRGVVLNTSARAGVAYMDQTGHVIQVLRSVCDTVLLKLSRYRTL